MRELPQVGDGGLVVEYREIAGFPGYFVGSDGSVWSSHRKFGRERLAAHRKLKPMRHSFGYLAVCMRGEGQQRQKGKSSTRAIHRLVLEAFVGPCPAGMEACHGDGDPTNNRLDNLRWDTPAANSEDSRRHGTDKRGSMRPGAKLHERDVPIIRELCRRGFNMTRIAVLFDVSENAILGIARGKAWTHVEDHGL